MSVTDKMGCDERMRWDGDVRIRLRDAAMALFAERGYDRTTAAGIAARAGVTERTFFRHFPDKREVLFDGEAVLRTALMAAIGDAPVTFGAIASLSHAFRAVAPMLEENRHFSVPRQALINAAPALRERETAKVEALAGALADALRGRGVPAEPAVLAARIGMAAFVQATLAWLDDPAIGLVERLDRLLAALKALIDETD